jgi:hypothetical protein
MVDMMCVRGVKKQGAGGRGEKAPTIPLGFKSDLLVKGEVILTMTTGLLTIVD